MKVLGIETSCDDTSAAVVENGRKVLSSVVSSQTRLHRRYQGVVPELASRTHLQNIAPVVDEALKRAGRPRRLDAIAYTQGPGLLGCLLVGKIAAQTLAHFYSCPAIGINHLEGHIFAAELAYCPRFPLVALIVSGGHTDLVLVRAPGRYRVLGRTRDDAAGEAFDKVARLLGLPYPGGPSIDRQARHGQSTAIEFPRPLMPNTTDFSFSGLKTAMLYHLRNRGGRKLSRSETADLCASFQEAVVDTLIFKTLAAAKAFGVRDIVVGGGVAANSRLRDKMHMQARAQGLRVLIPPAALCTDNGAMIAQVACHRLRLKLTGKPHGCDPALALRSWSA